MSAGGKGHAPRQTRDDDAFRKNWQLIFGNKKKEPEHCQNKGKCAEPFCSCEVKDEANT